MVERFESQLDSDNLYNKDYNWDIDLAFGEVGEYNLYKILKDSKLEVKRDRIALKTGNLAIEYEQNNKPSGIAISNAEYWCYIFTKDNYDKAIIIIPIERLKVLARKYFKLGNIKECGDNYNKIILIPVEDIFDGNI